MRTFTFTTESGLVINANLSRVSFIDIDEDVNLIDFNFTNCTSPARFKVSNDVIERLRNQLANNKFFYKTNLVVHEDNEDGFGDYFINLNEVQMIETYNLADQNRNVVVFHFNHEKEVTLCFDLYADDRVLTARDDSGFTQSEYESILARLAG